MPLEANVAFLRRRREPIVEKAKGILTQRGWRLRESWVSLSGEKTPERFTAPSQITNSEHDAARCGPFLGWQALEKFIRQFAVGRHRPLRASAVLDCLVCVLLPAKPA